MPPRIEVGRTASERMIAPAMHGLMMGFGITSGHIYDTDRRGCRVLMHHPDAAERARREAQRENFVGIGLQGLARRCLEAAGIHGASDLEAADLYDAVARPMASGFTMTTGDFPLILEATAAATLVAAYQGQPTTYDIWCQELSPPNFQTQDYLRFSEAPLLRRRAEGAPAEFGVFSEEREQYGVDEWALAVGLSRRMMINDDAGAFIRINQSMGSAIADTIEIDLWDKVLANSGVGPTMGDGTAMFHADHNNLDTTGAVPDQDEIEAGLARFTARTGFGQDGPQRPVAVMPAFLLASWTDYVEATKTLTAAFGRDDDSKPPQLDEIRVMRPIHVPQLTVRGERDWYLTGPRAMGAFGVAYLRGEKLPRLRRSDGFLTSGLGWVVEFDVDVYPLEHRMIDRNPGV